MERENLLGKMAENMKEIISLTKNMVMEFITGLMVKNQKVFGNMEKNKKNMTFKIIKIKIKKFR